MDTSLKWQNFPGEIMELAFGYLEEDSDIKNCRLVCSNWNTATFKRGIRVALGSAGRCEKLINDLVVFPQLAAKIRKLYISYINEDPIDPDMFILVLNKCTYIEKLRFCINQTGEQYLLALFDETPHISRMKEIAVDNVKSCSTPIRISYMLINFAYRNSITVLEISDVRDATLSGIFAGWQTCLMSECRENPRLATALNFMAEACHTLTEFASKFPKLKFLKVQPGLLSDDIDITALMATNNCTLETLHLSSSHCYLHVKKPFHSWPNTNPYNSLTELYISGLGICAETLECIMTFTNLKKLFIKLIVPSALYEYSRFNRDKTRLLVDRFTSFCNTIKNVEVDMAYETFAEDNAFAERQLVIKDGRSIDKEYKGSDLSLFFTKAFNIEGYDITNPIVIIHDDDDYE
ncbi:uncharacterized protein EV154DRAFT_487267 [Mucor mucedo]|uniref:uncharacterized protein n=1 Tax=Mucor mucedo TaxID=29922 RepID=UPI00221EAE74|nr:uncharacterized protein EV154DRAFT_487267 [Mucor mucedo]KAI7873341.1 hypothetical protein EV154DRAFT_487267 [Mucor mucedo]